MQIIRQTHHIHAPIHTVWQALVDPKEITSWGGGPAKMDEKIGTKFSLWGGDIHGTNKEIIPQKKLVQEWYGGKWDKPSLAIFELFSEKEGTRIEFTHTDIPPSDFKDIEKGWKDYYLGPLKDYVEGK